MKRTHSQPDREASARGGTEPVGGADHDIDRYRFILFPNHVRQLRKRQGYPKLLGLSALMPDIPYIRLSKIERGEVFAKADELRRIAGAVHVDPAQLLVDIDDPSFNIADWAADLQDWEATDPEQDRFAVELAAAIRALREQDKTLSIVAIERDYGIAPVILSRLENAYKTFDRWNAQTSKAVCQLFDVEDVAGLHRHVADARADGSLDRHLALVANPDIRMTKTRTRIAALREELASAPTATPAKAKAAQPRRPGSERDAAPSPAIAATEASDVAMVRLVPVFGTPLPDGLIERSATGETVEAPRRAGLNAYGLRIGRPTLGPGLPGKAIVVVDPDRFPSSGGIAVLREEGGLRLLNVTFDRQGHMVGYSANPDREITLDDIDPADVASVVSIVLD